MMWSKRWQNSQKWELESKRINENSVEKGEEIKERHKKDKREEIIKYEKEWKWGWKLNDVF